MGKNGAFYPKNQLGRMINHKLTESTNYNNLEEVGLSILRGYKFTLATLNREMCLQLDVCSRVLQSRSLLE